MLLPTPSPTLLCDTNVISELARPRPDPGVLTWAGTVSWVAVSAVSIEEIEFGLSWRPNVRVSQLLETFMNDHCYVIPVTRDIALAAGGMRGQLRARGEQRSQADMLIAATARVHHLTVVTRNIRDFEGCLVPLLNPFSSGRA